MTARAAVGGALLAATLLTGCAVGTTSAPPPAGGTPTASQKQVDPAQVERLKKAMLPLLAADGSPAEGQ